MMEREMVREREPEPSGNKYDESLRERAGWVDQAMTGEVLLRSADRPVEINRQGHIKRYLQPRVYPNTALTDWVVLTHDVQRQSGKHRHQGGLVIFVLEGQGTTEVDGLRLDWQAGDILLLKR